VAPFPSNPVPLVSNQVVRISVLLFVVCCDEIR
jgi:hypothetical protein